MVHLHTNYLEILNYRKAILKGCTCCPQSENVAARNFHRVQMVIPSFHHVWTIVIDVSVIYSDLKFDRKLCYPVSKTF